MLGEGRGRAGLGCEEKWRDFGRAIEVRKKHNSADHDEFKKGGDRILNYISGWCKKRKEEGAKEGEVG